VHRDLLRSALWEIPGPLVHKDYWEPLGYKDARVRKEFLVCKDLPVQQAPRAHADRKVRLVHKELRAQLVHKALKGPLGFPGHKVCKELKAHADHKVPQGLRASKVMGVSRELLVHKEYKDRPGP